MKRFRTTLATVALVGAIGTAAFAGPVTRFDNGYLDEHPEVAHQLGSNPSLADNPQFLATHPGLDAYLSNHPEVRQDLQQHPYRFMSDEWRHDHYGRGGYGITNGEVGRFDNGYLDEHPEVAEQLGRDPRLVDNPQYLATHPGLDEYFKNHPEIRAELQHHPDRFMARERYYERHGEAGGAHPLATTDRFLDSHPEVAQQLNRDPALVDNRKYADNHPSVHEYLQSHPTAQRDWKSHPFAYTAAERHYDPKH
jgi:hypothetical protein